MVLLRRVIGDALRARRQGQHRTLREVSTAANVSLGYLSEIERGQKEASSELLAAICEALGARLSEVLGEVSGTLALAEGMSGVLVPVEHTPAQTAGSTAAPDTQAAASAQAAQTVAAGTRVKQQAKEAAPVRQVTTGGGVSVSVRQDNPLKATLRTRRKRERDVVCAA
ncbi:helix-turn-helix domain-containing protein [Couchioplanes caeruleus]|uniref:Transcriptional regulator n=2 Tax=Couchioplanes caeruleus TaxID=56438 RepID=A0A1K0H0B6_9ACTN|nr:helix-turn-helix transcriptional regulator [Couchioplanes caeruleus]OJF15123.1 transcriptional regulator [Couchioplanes caeruleus subsp. caeruleus]ROP32607.1 helix-turn-helix protein [Couchioplanes caeruleus]